MKAPQGSGPVGAALHAAGPWPHFDDDMVAAAEAVLRSGKVNYWTGEEGKNFEKEFAAFHGIPFAVSVANGTQALELALQALGIGPGDDVLVSPRTFVASATCIVGRGARPVFADVDRDSGCVSAATLRAALTPRTRALVLVHLGGWPCDMDPILELARERNLKVVEDVAQALGGTDRGRPLGTIGDVGCFSFCQDKILTTAGEGGMVVTRDASLWERLWSSKDHGKSYEACFRRAHPPGFRWLHESFGTNSRMTEVQSAIGRVGLRRLPEWLKRRARNAALLQERLSPLPGLRVPASPPGHANYKFHFFVRPERLAEGWSRDRIMAESVGHGVPCYSGSCSEIYLEKAFVSAGFAPAGRLPVAREMTDTSLMMQVHPTLSEAAMTKSADTLADVMDQATR